MVGAFQVLLGRMCMQIRAISRQANHHVMTCCPCRFMKLRLDRVLELTIPDLTPEEALKAGAPIPDFQPLDKAEKWTAPYPPYAPGWWDTFVPKA